MLGLANISITLDTYSHVVPGMEEVAASAMEDARGDAPGVGGVGDVGDDETLSSTVLIALGAALRTPQTRLASPLILVTPFGYSEGAYEP
jgi:hypothetical protein